MIRIRGHHLLCIKGFNGYGYSKEFVENLQKIKERIDKEKNILIEITDNADDICRSCPRLIDGKCEHEIKGKSDIGSYDRKILEAIGIKPNTAMPVREIDILIKARFNSFEAIENVGLCLNCEWKEVCKFYNESKRNRRKN